MPIRGNGEGLIEEGQPGSSRDAADETKTVYVLHPNCAVEDI